MSDNMPSVTYRTAGDGSTIARITWPDGRLPVVHSNKSASVLRKLIEDRYLAPARYQAIVKAQGSKS